jgi:hypothetical protein
MLNKDKSPRTYKHIDPENMPESTLPPYQGTNAECLADALLDVLQVAMESGMQQSDVDEAMRIVADTLAEQERHKFRLHLKDAGGDAGEQD